MIPKMNGNPFYHLTAIDQVEHFYNRRSEVHNALRLLRKSQNVGVMGPRRIGKTSFLRYISHPATLQEYGIDPRLNLFVYIDCQHRLIQQEKHQVYKMMLECIAEAAHRFGIDFVPESWDESTAGAVFEFTLEEMSRQGLRTILLWDEFEEMARNPHLDPGFFSNLRALCSADDIAVVYVTASCDSLADLCLERQSLLSSPFFNIFRPIRLGLFNEQDSQHLVDDSLHRVGACLPKGLLELVLEVGGGHPFFLQMAGYHAFDLAVTGEELTEDQHKAFLEAVSAEATGHFKSYWQKLDEQEQYVLAALPLVWKDLNYQETIEHLRDQCLITRHNGRYDYLSPLFEAFVRRQEVNGLLQAGPLLVDQRQEQVILRGEPLSLSPTNYALLTCLMQRAGQVVSNEELWRAVWSEESYNADQQLKSSVKSLRKALGDDASCIVNRRSVGYIFQRTDTSR